ncbi:MAG: peptidylprolyl isomerase [Verrucomicrobiota bacterium]|jgi:peptidyl-prolyl cis-trans isomerase C
MIKSLVLLLLATSLPAWGASPDQPVSTNAAAPPVPASKPASLFGNNLVAKGKGVEVKRSQLDEQVIRFKSQAAGRAHPVPPEQTGALEQYLLEQLIQGQLLQARVTDADKAAGKALAEKRLAEAKTQYGSEEALNRQLKLMGTTREEALAEMTEQGAAQMLAKRELKVNVTDEDARKYYDENPGRFEEPEMVRASHILLTTTDPKTNAELTEDQKAAKRKQMEGLLKRARAGEDFAKLAREYSEDPGSKDKGGEYKFPRGQMVAEFEAAAFSLNTNQVSDIITTRFGYHIIKLSEKIPARKIEFAKAASDIKEGLTQQALQKQFPDYIAKLKKEAGVEILDEKLKPKETSDAPALPPGHPPVKAGTQ